MKNQLALAQEAVELLNENYNEQIFSVRHDSTELEAVVMNDLYRYEGNDVDITFDERGITGTATGIATVSFKSLEQLTTEIDQLFLNDYSTKELERLIAKLEPQVGDTIVTFQISGGGGNRNKREYIGERKISDFTGNLFVYAENHSEVIAAIDAIENNERRQILENNYSSYCNGADEIVKIDLEDALGIEIGELVYFDSSGHNTGLSLKEAEQGIGRIEIDTDFDTTYTSYLKDCDQDEFKIIESSYDFAFLSPDAKLFVKYNIQLNEAF